MSAFIMPAVLGAVLLYGLSKGISVYSAMTDGVKKGMRLCASILPPVLVMLTAVRMLEASGVTAAVSGVIAPFLESAGFPPECVSLSLIRPFSFGSSVSCYTDIAISAGAGSRAERIAAVILASGDAGFYVISLYSGGAGVKKCGRVLACVLFAHIVSYIAAALAVALI